MFLMGIGKLIGVVLSLVTTFGFWLVVTYFILLAGK